MRPITVVVGPLAAASANAICLTQTPSAGALTLNGALVVSGVAVLDTPRRVLLTTTGNETGKTLVLTGTGATGQIQTETLAAPNAGTVYSALDYATVTSITISAAAAGALTVGTNGVASSSWVALDCWAPAQVALQCNVTGTVNYTVQQTLDDPNNPINPTAPALVAWLNSPDAAVVGATTTVQSNYAYAPTYVKVTLNSGSGSVIMRVIQHSVTPY